MDQIKLTQVLLMLKNKIHRSCLANTPGVRTKKYPFSLFDFQLCAAVLSCHLQTVWPLDANFIQHLHNVFRSGIITKNPQIGRIVPQHGRISGKVQRISTGIHSLSMNIFIDDVIANSNHIHHNSP